VVAVAILVFFAPLMTLLAWVGTVLDIRPLAGVAARLNAMAYFTNFSIGVFDSGGLVYFLSVTALFLFLSVKVLESRRWR
jgi:ABC-2 type transport system permease protein